MFLLFLRRNGNISVLSLNFVARAVHQFISDIHEATTHLLLLRAAAGLVVPIALAFLAPAGLGQRRRIATGELCRRHARGWQVKKEKTHNQVGRGRQYYDDTL